MKNQQLKEAISAASSSQGIPLSKLTNNLNTAAVMSKLVGDNSARGRRYTDRYGPDQSTLRGISHETASKISDANNFMQLLPDLKLGIEILISSVLSPKDMLSTAVTFNSECVSLPQSILASLNSITDEFFNKDYKIKDLLPEMLWDILVTSGSYCIAVLPENTIDEVINRGRYISTEHFKEVTKEEHFLPLGILGPAIKKQSKLSYSFESYTQSRQVTTEEQFIKLKDNQHMFINVSDNPNVIRKSRINTTLAEATQLKLLGYGKALESYDGFDLYARDQAVQAAVYKDRVTGVEPMVVLKTQEQLSRRSASGPLIMRIPSESVIPVFTPNDPTEHLGYFVVYDEMGNPLNTANTSDYYEQLRTSLNSAKTSNTSFVQRIQQHIGGTDLTTNGKVHVDNIIAAYTDIIETDLINRIHNGVMGNGELKISNSNNIIQIMLARTLRQQFTQVVYFPKQLLSYIAIDFNSYGIGKSLIEDMRVLCGLRVISMFSNMMASIKNSIGRTEVTLKLDEEDADPMNTIETVMAEFNRLRSGLAGAMPISAGGPMEVVDWLSNAGYEFTFEGHPSLPDVKIDVSESNTNYTKVDTDLEEDLRKRTSMAISVPPEIIDSAFSPDFATVYAGNNLLFSKRVMQIQDQFLKPLTEHMKKIIENDQSLIDLLLKVIDDNLDDVIERLISKETYPSLNRNTTITDAVRRTVKGAVLRDYIAGFEVNLPRPNSTELENQIEAFDIQVKALDAGLNTFFDSAFANSDTMGDLGDKMDILKESIKAMFLRQWMAENNFLPELFEMVSEDETGKLNRDPYDDITDHNHKLSKAVARFLTNLKEYKDAGDEFTEKMGETETDNTGGGDDTADTEDTGMEDDFTDPALDEAAEDTGDEGGEEPEADAKAAGDEAEE